MVAVRTSTALAGTSRVLVGASVERMTRSFAAASPGSLTLVGSSSAPDGLLPARLQITFPGEISSSTSAPPQPVSTSNPSSAVRVFCSNQMRFESHRFALIKFGFMLCCVYDCFHALLLTMQVC